MGYGLWFGIVVLLFAWMHFFTELSSKQKGTITLAITLLISAAIAYNVAADRDRAHVTDIELRYRHGETLRCAGVEVNASTFDYSDGTQSFVGLKATPYYQQIFNVRECQ